MYTKIVSSDLIFEATGQRMCCPHEEEEYDTPILVKKRSDGIGKVVISRVFKFKSATAIDIDMLRFR
ncbi:hypothetical protein RIF29_29670 [Crotalaria pallida]|uniref:Uncharacterized protein n=1 Tax=Crotalaria pallida TaxID=3830 RepID=A0AAN9EHB3_CROPI